MNRLGSRQGRGCVAPRIPNSYRLPLLIPIDRGGDGKAVLRFGVNAAGDDRMHTRAAKISPATQFPLRRSHTQALGSALCGSGHFST